MRHRGQEVVIHGRDGRRYRGFMDGVDPQEEFLFEMDSVEGVFFLSYLLLRFSLLGEDDVYFKIFFKKSSENVQPFCSNTI